MGEKNDFYVHTFVDHNNNDIIIMIITHKEGFQSSMIAHFTCEDQLIDREIHQSVHVHKTTTVVPVFSYIVLF